MRQTLKRFMPTPETIKQNKFLAIFGTLLHNPALWHLNRHSVAMAFFVGLFVCFEPAPLHMITAAAMAILLHANLPLSIALVWLSNPLTMPPMFYFAYKFGNWVLGIPPRPFHFELTWHWLASEAAAIWQPFLLGCLLAGLISGALGYLAIRLLWRLSIIHKWKTRRKGRVVATALSPESATGEEL